MSFPTGLSSFFQAGQVNSAKRDIFLVVAVTASIVAASVFAFLSLLSTSFALGALASGFGAPAVVPAAVAAVIFGGLAVGSIALTYYFFKKL